MQLVTPIVSVMAWTSPKLWFTRYIPNCPYRQKSVSSSFLPKLNASLNIVCRRQAIIWTNAGILLIRHFSEILIGIQSFSFKKSTWKVMSSVTQSNTVVSESVICKLTVSPLIQRCPVHSHVRGDACGGGGGEEHDEVGVAEGGGGSSLAWNPPYQPPGDWVTQVTNGNVLARPFKCRYRIHTGHKLMSSLFPPKITWFNL